MAELGRVTYVYYTLHKTLYTLARYLGTQQGGVLCDDGDYVVQSAKAYAISGNTDGSGEATLQGLTADMIQVRLERYDPQSASLGQCECSITGCDAASGGTAPDFIAVSMPGRVPRSTHDSLSDDGGDPVPSVRARPVRRYVMRGRRGQATVEYALTFSALIMPMIGHDHLHSAVALGVAQHR